MERSSKKKLFIILGVVAVLAVIVIANLKKSGGSAVTVQTDKVTRGDITSSVSGSARIQPEIQVKISAKVSGQITDLGVEEGDYVKKGQFLVRLDQEFYRAAVEQSESNLRFAQAGFEKSENEYKRSQKLFQDNLISQAELDIAKSTYEQAKAQVEQYDASLRQAKDNLDKTTIYAPMDGTVSQLNKKIGEMAMGSQFTLDVIMVVADLTRMLAETEIDENDVVNVSIGDTANVVIDAFPDTTFRSVVKEIANTGSTKGMGTQEEVTNFLVKAFMLDLPGGLRPGMSATVDVQTDTRKNVLKIPIQCLTMREPIAPEDTVKTGKGKISGKSKGKEKDAVKDEKAPEGPAGKKAVKDEPVPKEPIQVIFVVKDGMAHQRAVVTGISSDTEWEVVSGLEEGVEVVSGSYRILSKQLKDGDKVKIDNSLKKFKREEETEE